jgi:hypothetical protein
MTRWLALLGLLALALPTRASARAKVVMQLEGTGFMDATPVSPVGGNPGKTLGEQRRLALSYALGLWEARLDSQVPIVLKMTFDSLGCQGTAVELGGTRPTAAFTNLNALGATNASPTLFYVSALADSLVGSDLRPGEPDIQMEFNADIDTSCKDQFGGFYYGFDGKPEEASDFVEVILHEFAHGIGITSLWNPRTGEWIMSSGVDSYSANIRDLDLNKAWPDITTAERVQSATNVRHLVWDGREAGRLVPDTFAVGEPSLLLEPQVSGYSGFVADSNFGKSVVGSPVTASLVLESTCSVSSSSSGRLVFLLPDSNCKMSDRVKSAVNAGVAGLLLQSPMDFDAPAMPWDVSGQIPMVPFPVSSVSASDANDIVAAARSADLRATIGANAMRRSGADDKQRPLLFASQPYSAGSSVSHLEELVRPNQLMEPVATTPTHDIAFTVAMLRDVGWSANCGNGTKDPGEDCDDGAKNTDSVADACRTDCRLPRCGDGIRDQGESCDDGDDNNDKRADACRTTCKLAQCGDGVVDRNEVCDRGALNSDREANACRMNCHTPYCGDGVVDALEQCDKAQANSNTHANACRTDCRPARCGDGVVDDGEECDGTAGCSSACMLPPAPPVIAHAADGGQPTQLTSAAGVDGGANMLASTAPRASGCGCRVIAQPSQATHSLGFLLSCAAWRLARRKRQRIADPRHR